MKNFGLAAAEHPNKADYMAVDHFDRDIQNNINKCNNYNHSTHVSNIQNNIHNIKKKKNNIIA